MCDQPVAIGHEATAEQARALIDRVRRFEPVRRITPEQAAHIRQAIDQAIDDAETGRP